jgi:hypothetical protein
MQLANTLPQFSKRYISLTEQKLTISKNIKTEKSKRPTINGHEILYKEKHSKQPAIATHIVICQADANYLRLVRNSQLINTYRTCRENNSGKSMKTKTSSSGTSPN